MQIVSNKNILEQYIITKYYVQRKEGEIKHNNMVHAPSQRIVCDANV